MRKTGSRYGPTTGTDPLNEPAPERIRFRLHLDWSEFEPFYHGHYQTLIVTAEDGREVAFPASAVQRFLRPGGIHGRFELRYDGTSGRLLGIEALE